MVGCEVTWGATVACHVRSFDVAVMSFDAV